DSTPHLSPSSTTPSTPATPALSGKENPPPSSLSRAPHSSAFSSLSSIGGNSSSDKPPISVTPKPTFEDKLLGLQQDMMQRIEKRSDAQKQLLAEYTASLWTPEQYHEERKKLEEQYYSPKKHRAPSPDWDYGCMEQDIGRVDDFNFNFSVMQDFPKDTGLWLWAFI
ncbi:hypothetical protein GYMLUDRAFT_249142, partial [Collybiopsis luxurians FD-317 M1]